MKNESPMLLLTINNSIGNKNKHMVISELIELFEKKENFSTIENYAIDKIQTEATPQEIEFFTNKYNIPKVNLDYILSIKPY